MLLPPPGGATNAFVATSLRNRTASRDCSGRCHIPFGAARTASSPHDRGIVLRRENRTGHLLPLMWQHIVLLPHLPKKDCLEPVATSDLKNCRHSAHTPGFQKSVSFFGMLQQTRLLSHHFGIVRRREIVRDVAISYSARQEQHRRQANAESYGVE